MNRIDPTKLKLQFKDGSTTEIEEMIFFTNGSVQVNAEFPVNDPQMEKYGGQQYFIVLEE